MLFDSISGLRPLPKNAIVEISNSIYMRQSFEFYSRLKAKEFLNFMAELENKTIDDFFKFLKKYDYKDDLEKILDTNLGMLSGGERRKIYLLAILSTNKDWYLLDEPFANLDKETTTQICELIAKLNKQENKNFLITSHIDLSINVNVINFDNII